MNNIRAVLNLSNCYNSSLNLHPASPGLLFLRFASHKVKRNTRQKSKPPGVKRLDGDYVRKGEIIVVQFNLHFHPGLNVTISNENTLLAMTDGRIMMTCEKINPKEDSFIAQKYYANMAAPAVYKRYFHVVPFKQGQKFKLVNLV